jgi:DNA-binding GntR family transcriptional regulator
VESLKSQVTALVTSLVRHSASYLPVSVAEGTFLEEPTVVPKALFLCVEDLTGHRYTRARDQWIVRMPTAEESVILELPNGAPVMNVIHTACDENGHILEISESVWPSSKNPSNPKVPSEM